MAINIVWVVMSYALVTTMNNQAWLQQLEMLLIRFSHLDIGADVVSLSMIELWALYLYLSRLVDG